ncbi:MAG: ornithine--oxo-acid transaminase [Deltaproteobacteria bacterium]|nr:ornithine--oxo-acid transaminase [Deltaproteobacteria bacterium]
MDRSQQLIGMAEKFGAHNYHPLPVVLERGKGIHVWDVAGRKYLDFLSSYSALNFGHSHPALVSTLVEQAQALAVCSRAFHSEQLCLFSADLARFCQMDAILPMNSGAEAVETAIKIARKWGYERKKVQADSAKIIVMDKNFHGRTIGVISASSEPLYRKNFGPFTPGFEIVPFDNVKALQSAVDHSTVAILLEPIQAEAGVQIPHKGFLQEVQNICQKQNCLLMLDEIQTGLGRTGKEFCYQYEEIKPDVLIMGKSLGGGLLPLSAVAARSDVMEVMTPGTHGSTFGGMPLSCAVGRTALWLLRKEGLADRAAKLGELVREKLAGENLPHVKEVRGRGLLIGIELKAEARGARRYCEKLADEGVLCKETHENVIRIAPPLIIEEPELMGGVDKVIHVIRSLA